MEQLLTLSEAAAVLKVNPATLRAWLRAGSVRGVKVGREWRVSESAIRDVAERGVSSVPVG